VWVCDEIYSGDIKSFAKAVLNKIDEIDAKPYVTNLAAIEKPANRYSAQVEMTDMQFVSRKIHEILGNMEVE
jgi:hypothetical protein